MATEAQVCANRSNAQKSTGPRTVEGRAAVAQNAVKHGLLARAAVLQGEEWEEYTCFHEELMDELYPDSMQEEELAERIVSLSWRLRRAEQYQNAVFEALYDKYAAETAEPGAHVDPIPSVPSDPVLGRMLLADFSGDRVLERVLQYERRIESSLYRTRAELRNLQRLRKQEGASSRRREVAGEQDRAWNPPLPPTPDLGSLMHSSAFESPFEFENSVAPPGGISTGEGIRVQGGTPIAMNRDWEPGSGVSDLTPDPRPLTHEPSCETNPIFAGANRDQPGYRPIFGGAGGR